MRVAKNLSDVNIIVKSIQNQLDSLTSANQNKKGYKITNCGAATNPDDVVTLAQLQGIQQSTVFTNSYFSIPFSSTGVVNVGDLVAPYTPGTGRVGKPFEVIIAATVPPVSQDLKANVQINGTKILKNDITLPIGTTTAIIGSDFINGLPMVSRGCVIVPVITQSDGQTALVTITLVVQKQ